MFILKIINALKEKVLIYRIKRYFQVKFFLKAKLHDYSFQIYEEKIFFSILDVLEYMSVNFSYKFIIFQNDILCFTEKNYKN